jgi:CubicO group peptidase (beta-lactamase class C family)
MSKLTISQFQDVLTNEANNAVNKGYTLGISIGAIQGDHPPFTASAGVSNYESQQPVTPDTIFQIASVTKIFTTGYFGQLVSDGAFSLQQPLSDFTNGALPGLSANPALGAVTLQDISTFTAGLPSDPPKEVTNYGRPTIAQWGVADFESWFVGLPPQGNYIYSNTCIGMLGLLSTNANPTISPLPTDGVNVWLDTMQRNILSPLAMKDTVVVGISELTSSQRSRLASGYQQAVATAEISNGSVSNINVEFPGVKYKTPPTVSIVSDTGSGATAIAVLANGRVNRIQVTNGGSGYTSSPNVLVEPNEPSSNNLPVWAAAGGFSSTVTDMLAMVRECLAASCESTPLQAGLNIAMKKYGTLSKSKKLEFGMAWEIETGNSKAGDVIFKPGGLPGFSSYLCILPKHNLGFIALCNSTLPNGSEDLAPAKTAVSSIIKQLFP